MVIMATKKVQNLLAMGPLILHLVSYAFVGLVSKSRVWTASGCKGLREPQIFFLLRRFEVLHPPVAHGFVFLLLRGRGLLFVLLIGRAQHQVNSLPGRRRCWWNEVGAIALSILRKNPVAFLTSVLPC